MESRRAEVCVDKAKSKAQWLEKYKVGWKKKNFSFKVLCTWIESNLVMKYTLRVFISAHNLLTMWVTMWAEFRSHCDSQYQMTLEYLLTIYSNLVKYFLRKKEFFRKENSSMEKHRKNVNFGPILRKFIFLKWI